MLQIGFIDAVHCIDVPKIHQLARHVSHLSQDTPIARHVSLTLFTERNDGKPFVCCAEPSRSSITK